MCNIYQKSEFSHRDYLKASPGEKIQLDVRDSYDPDGDNLVFNWWFYKEPSMYFDEIPVNGQSTALASFMVPDNARGKHLHLVLEVKDDNEIASMFSYKRFVIQVSE